MAKTTKKTVKKTPKSYKYTVIVKTKGEEYKKDTNDIAKTLLGFGITNTNTVTDIIVKSGKKEVVKHLMVYKARRVFNNAITAGALADNFKLLLNGK